MLVSLLLKHWHLDFHSVAVVLFIVDHQRRGGGVAVGVQNVCHGVDVYGVVVWGGSPWGSGLRVRLWLGAAAGVSLGQCTP